MPTRFSAIRKKRGHVSAGNGRVGKHRKHPSGRGNAGGQHHHRIWWDKYHPLYFSKIGMRHFHWKKSAYHCPTINVGSVVPPVISDAEKKAGKVPVINLVAKGYGKLLGKGSMRSPCIVKTRLCSRLAEKSIKKAGGAVVIVP
eukprot:TRINITY_DN65151_c0_g1_i1.p1 TRINITY_DN65151_c0_g1~~TRINITY_DN65151_c0_g1_i1.p1  ORF type:complete len:143 (-),score=15.29 TRINITY_DN65151_c0_g1_i1:101-529(-)